MNKTMPCEMVQRFQPVIYLTDTIKDIFRWKGFELEDLFTFSKVAEALGDDEILTFLSLNSADTDKSIFLNFPFPYGTDKILALWHYGVNNNLHSENKTLELEDDLRRIEENIKLNLHHSKALTSLELEINEPTGDGPGYYVSHNRDHIFVVFRTDEINFLNKDSHEDLIKDFTREIIKTYNLYTRYCWEVSKSSWFKLYVESL